MALLKRILKKKLSMKEHSPAGREYLKRKKKKKVTYSSLRTNRVKSQLKKAGISGEDLRALMRVKDR